MVSDLTLSNLKKHNHKNYSEMKNIIFGFCFILIFKSVIISQPHSLLNENAVKRTVLLEIKLHPKATLLDLYKNFFQGKFGPGHLIKNRGSAENYLEYELTKAEEYDSILIQPVGYEENFFRINLILIKENKIEKGELIDAFVESANSVDKPEIVEWKEEWNSILQIIEEMDLNLLNYEEDKIKILNNLDEGIVIGHHSKTYLQHYHPHYRIVNKKQMEGLNEFTDLESR